LSSITKKGLRGVHLELLLLIIIIIFTLPTRSLTGITKMLAKHPRTKVIKAIMWWNIWRRWRRKLSCLCKKEAVEGSTKVGLS